MTYEKEQGKNIFFGQIDTEILAHYTTRGFEASYLSRYDSTKKRQEFFFAFNLCIFVYKEKNKKKLPYDNEAILLSQALFIESPSVGDDW